MSDSLPAGVAPYLAPKEIDLKLNTGKSVKFRSMNRKFPSGCFIS